MNLYSMGAGEIPDEIADRKWDADEVFKNFVPKMGKQERSYRPQRITSAKGREVVVEVRRVRGTSANMR